jgi:ubiquinone/menaquinone biosynthesis C-methylase UbiE
MTAPQTPASDWGSSYRLIAAAKWKAKSAAMGRAVTEALVNYAAPALGMNVLDLASGTGEPAITLAQRVGPQGHVTALDLSEDLLKIAAERARQRGLLNISTRTADAHNLPFDDESFDLVTSRFGVMFFEDGIRALRETLRVLKSGGRVCFAAWGTSEQPFWSSMMGVVHRYAGGILTEPNADPFRYSKAGALSNILRETGFQHVEEEVKTLPWTWPGTADEVWELTRQMATPFQAMIDRVPADQWDRINREVIETINQYASADGINFGAVVVFCSGRKL